MKILVPAALMAALLATEAAAGATLVFDVLLDSRPIGTHTFEMQGDAAGTYQVRSQAAFNVKILGITAYRYRHQASEQWAQGCLQSVDASTDDNGKRAQVRRTPIDGCSSSYAYWDRDLLIRQHHLLNPQTGQVDAVQIDRVGEERITVRGTSASAVHYRLRSAKFTIDLWYSPSGEWLQLDSTTESSRTLQYRLAPAQR